MASLTRCTWVWVNSGSWWWTGRPSVLRFMGSQRLGHYWATELSWTETMVQVMKIMVPPWKGPMLVLLHTVAILQQAPAALFLCQRLLDTHRQIWVSLLWCYCSFLFCPGVHKFLFVPSKSQFLQSCVSSGSSMVGLMATSSKRAYAITKSAVPRAPASAAVHCWPVPPWETLKHSSVSVYGVFWSCCTQGLFEPPEHLCWVWGLILNAISPLIPSF